MCFRSYDVNGSLLGSESADWVPSSFFLGDCAIIDEDRECKLRILVLVQQPTTQRPAIGGGGEGHDKQAEEKLE